MRHWRIGVLGLVLCLTLTACTQAVDLDAIRSFTASITASEPALSAMADDFYASCLRLQYWKSVNTNPLEVIDEKACAPHRNATEQWRKTNQIILSYVRALGELAGGSESAAGPGIKQLASELSTLSSQKLFSQGDVEKLGEVGDRLAGYINQARRRDEIAKFADRADKDVQLLVLTLRAAVEKNYTDALNLEIGQLDSFYRDNIIKLPSDFGVARFERLNYVDAWVKARDAVQSRKNAIPAYLAILDNIGKTHAGLVKSIRDNKAGDIKTSVQTFLSIFGPAISILARVYWPAGGPR